MSVVDPNSTPSMKHALADSVASLSGSNKISTPILSNNQQSNPSQQAQQRYAPARQVNPPPQPRQPQAQLDTDEFDENGNLLEPIALSPRPNKEPEQVPYTKSPVYKLTDPRYQTGTNQRSPLNSERVVPTQQTQQPTSSASSFRSGLEQPPLQRPTQQPPPQPQPLTRTVRQPPPPVPADRASISSRDRVQQPDYDSQVLAAQQEFEQQRQLNDRAMQILTNRQQQQQQPQPSSLRQPTSSSTAISREYKTNETSKSGSNISTPDASRSKKQIVTEVNHKDLLLRAIQMATDLDPELEVEKVEITTEE